MLFQTTVSPARFTSPYSPPLSPSHHFVSRSSSPIHQLRLPVSQENLSLQGIETPSTFYAGNAAVAKSSVPVSVIVKAGRGSVAHNSDLESYPDGEVDYNSETRRSNTLRPAMRTSMEITDTLNSGDYQSRPRTMAERKIYPQTDASFITHCKLKDELLYEENDGKILRNHSGLDSKDKIFINSKDTDRETQNVEYQSQPMTDIRVAPVSVQSSPSSNTANNSMPNKAPVQSNSGSKLVAIAPKIPSVIPLTGDLLLTQGTTSTNLPKVMNAQPGVMHFIITNNAQPTILLTHS